VSACASPAVVAANRRVAEPRRRFAARLHGLLAATALVVLSVFPPRSAARESAAGLTAAPLLAQVYDTIFDARFAHVPSALREACGPAPPEACVVLNAVALGWQIRLDPLNPIRDAEFQTRVNEAIEAAGAWTRREPRRAEAWFYLGGAYGARVQWRVLRGERIAAARDGKRIKDALETALAIESDFDDAWFGIGLYHYYADVGPAAAKVLRWLLLLPGGDRVKGMQEMLRARDRGSVTRDEADYQLQVIYLWYERNPARALELIEGLRRRHPGNPHFLELIADVQDTYQHDRTASLRSWRVLFDAARQQKVELADMAETRARLGMALQLDRLFETDKAIDHVRAVIAARPTTPYGAVALAQLQLGQALDRMGARSDAVTAYRAALALAPPDDPLGIVGPAHAGLRQAPNTRTSQAYRRSLEGWRALERGDIVAAAREIDQSLALRPEDPVARYRQARLLEAQRDESRALAVLEALVRERATTPPTVYAEACVDAARLHEQRGANDRAIELYRDARTVFGADQRTKDAAERALTRLTSSQTTRR
jgi:tetratricopeptide (TPR) repeat protein